MKLENSSESHLPVLISTKSFESLVPDFMMETPYFYLVILDIEGKVVKFNHNFERVDANPLDVHFYDFLSPASGCEFRTALDLMLSTPQTKRNVVLDHPWREREAVIKICWEFSVVTTPDMDVSGIVGVGVDPQLSDQVIPWHSLVEVLGFGKIVLDTALHIQSWDARISDWFDPEEGKWEGTSLMETAAFKGIDQLSDVFAQVSKEAKVARIHVKTNLSDPSDFVGLLTVNKDGYEIFLVPKERFDAFKNHKILIPSHLLLSLPGAVFVLDNAGKLLQQNEAGEKLGIIWRGSPYSEGFSLTFPTQPSRFTKLLRAIEEARKGMNADLEVRMLMPGREFACWSISLRPIPPIDQEPGGILIQIVDLTSINSQLMRTNRENERLRELALNPSHILRGPLSSMIGLLELIDIRQLDKENQNLFRYLKPLTKELDKTIRQHAKKISAFG